MYTLLIMILWTWGLTPLWVNIVGSIVGGLGILVKVVIKLPKLFND